MIYATDYVIGDDNFEEASRPEVDGHLIGTGLIPRDYEQFPVGSYGGSLKFGDLNEELPLVPWEAFPDLIADKVRTKSQLSDFVRTGNNGQPIPSLNQNGQGYCWFYSVTSATTALRARDGLPYVRLSGHSGACKIKGFRDQGGWGAQGIEFAMKNGIVPVTMWAERSMSRSYDTEQAWEEAKKYRISEGFIDLDEPVYSRDLTRQQRFTCLINLIPVIGDRSWWGHSTCDLDVVDAFPNLPATNPDRYGVRTWNSWGDSWGDRGMGVITGRKVDAAGVAPRAVVMA